MRKILLLIIAITMLCSCDKDDKENNEIPIPQPFPQEEQNRLIKELAGFWEELDGKNTPNDGYAFGENFGKYMYAQCAGDTFVLPRIEKLYKFELSPGLEIDGHKTIWFDYRNTLIEPIPENYYISNDTLYVYQIGKEYENGKVKIIPTEPHIYKRRPEIKVIKEEDVNKELIGKWVNQQGFGSFEFFDDFTYVYTNGYGRISNGSYSIEYWGGGIYYLDGITIVRTFIEQQGNTLILNDDNKIYIKQE